jgi:signal-transduction protein with cAMP-binding, CBS, and nucleotidyltransferase domain
MTEKEDNSTARVAHYTNKNLVTIDSDTTAFEIANKMLEKRVGAVIVMDSGQPVGILTERDLTRQVCAKDTLPSKTPATAIMSSPIVSIDKDLPIERAAQDMLKNNIRHLAVQEGDKIIGMITTTDLSRYIKEKLPDKECISGSILEVLYSSEEPSEESWI